MSIWNSICGLFGWGATNPATGLPMVSGDTSGVDVGGSPYGTDFHHDSFVDHSSSGWDSGFSGGWDSGSHSGWND